MQSQGNATGIDNKHHDLMPATCVLPITVLKRKIQLARLLCESNMLVMTFPHNLTPIAPVILRFGLAGLFLWFGVSQILSPDSWTAWVPEWINRSSVMSATMVVLINGWFEVVGGILLASGFKTRWVALALSLHLFFIALEVGYNDIGVRDFALATSTLAVAFFGPDIYSIDNRLANRDEQ